MAAPRIKKKSSASKGPAVPRQGVIPCLILLVILLALIAFFFFAGFHFGG